MAMGTPIDFNHILAAINGYAELARMEAESAFGNGGPRGAREKENIQWQKFW